MRYLLLALFVGIVGYAVGVLSGYRTATVDYVENDARNIRKLAASMYGSSDEEELESVFEAASDESDTDTEDDSNTANLSFQ
jgi:hypothetical protein